MMTTYMHILQKGFAAADLRDVLTQSAVIAEGFVDSALRRKSYNRGVRNYKLFYEALRRLLINTLINQNSHVLKDWFTEIQSYTPCFHTEIVENLKEKDEFKAFYQTFVNLKNEWKKGNSGLQIFWLSYIEMVEIMLNNLYACRSGKWELLLECIGKLIAYTFAYDHMNYARYLSIILSDKKALEEEFSSSYLALSSTSRIR